MTNQPNWQFVANLGDVDPATYGGYLVFRDTTGVYAPEMVIWVPSEDGETVEESRVVLERHTWRDGVLSDNLYHPTQAVWYADKLTDVAETLGIDAAELRADLCSDDAGRRGWAYQTLIGYFGTYEFDQYPRSRSTVECAAAYHGLTTRTAGSNMVQEGR